MVACPPYDVLTEVEARQFAGENPICFLRVKRPELQFGQGTDPHCDAAYDAAASLWQKFLRDGVFVPDPSPAYFVYRQKMGTHTQTGIVGLCSVNEYDDDTIKKHEKTRPDKEDDRTRHMTRTRAQYGPVFLTYREHKPLLKLMNEVAKREPEYSVEDEKGVVHTVWRVDFSEPVAEKIQAEFAKVPYLYIADGHHRAKSASRAREEFALLNSNHLGTEGYNMFLSVLFPADQLQILPYNRVVHSLKGRQAQQTLRDVEERFTVKALAEPAVPNRGTFTLYLGGHWYSIKPRASKPKDPLEALDVAVLQRELLEPVFGIEDPRTDRNIEFVGGIHPPEKLKARADETRGAAIIVHPTSIEDVLNVADSGGVMPPKSTWFEPKLRSGLFVYGF